MKLISEISTFCNSISIFIVRGTLKEYLQNLGLLLRKKLICRSMWQVFVNKRYYS